MGLISTARLLGNLVLIRLKHGHPRHYDRHWENYWSSIEKTGQDGQVLWDNVAEKAAAEDLSRFQRYLDPSLPVLDLGCGNGRQSRFLARHFKQVVGVDVSPAAVELARRETVEEKNVDYHVLDGTRPEQAEALHRQYGDMNIYMRAVLHVIRRADRPHFVQSLATLLGERGTLYQIELSHTALSYFRTVPADTPFGIPKLVWDVIRHGPSSVGFGLSERKKCFPDRDWQVIESSSEVSITTRPLADGQEGHVPANFLILRPRRAQGRNAEPVPAGRAGQAA
ncbi:MAG TPA: class I SAM-dependent methyltransferase [Thermoanaerobaculia bacterium]|nr:class I SAM-dependent methyltransferase [Thermoanaerobaculia bacterium]